ncbi:MULTISPECIES: DUF397 domain-containing protein [unclassified Streptomyces]|uniref:DUF397 domain-containing protein n=1 Tax=unclassified Streptomyces TaxID=2593676 RepID=UPI00099FB87B|nr:MULTISPECIES: DUF397 domain-containing protein [unclassified Streptomyces]WAX78281.1 DUF397 domain-containing protein [Streptomyces sp. KMM 9044]
MRAAIGLSPIRWRKSSYSNVDGGNCLEVADGFPDAVPVRDSKAAEGPILMIPRPAWTQFVGSIKHTSK